MLQAIIVSRVSYLYYRIPCTWCISSHIDLVVLDKIRPICITRSAYNTNRTYGPHRSCYNITNDFCIQDIQSH